ncbi:hypothetical protein [Virgisporangium aurantiacum]|uniref:hypothetical protein n=1 Tax=Virgisporangium aurantiacum TaxID=175570 RepID=UPI00194E14B3|nr:hypothetical protein [Virgisporangium aurantiacum]
MRSVICVGLDRVSRDEGDARGFGRHRVFVETSICRVDYVGCHWIRTEVVPWARHTHGLKDVVGSARAIGGLSPQSHRATFGQRNWRGSGLLGAIGVVGRRVALEVLPAIAGRQSTGGLPV